MTEVNLSQNSTIGQNVKTGLSAKYVPVYGNYKIGEAANNLKNATEQLDSFVNGEKVPEKKELSAFGKFVKGAGVRLSMLVPFYDIYKAGKSKNDIKYGKKAVEAINNGKDVSKIKKAGVVKNFATGVVESLKFLLPGYGAIYTGKQINEANNLAKDVDELFAAGCEANEVETEHEEAEL